MAATRADDPLPPRAEHVQQVHAKKWRVLELVGD